MLFERNLEYRDNGTISIGTYFRILSPLPIENNMRGDIPLVKTQLPIIVLKSPSKVASVPVDLQLQEQTSMAFVYNKVSLKLICSTPLQTKCSGFFYAINRE